MTLASADGADRRILPIALTISSAFLMESLDGTILVAAIPAIAADFGVSPLQVNLTISLYLVTLGACIPASSWLADRLGAKSVFLWAMVLFMLTSIGAALSSSLEMLVTMRIIQAAAGAMMTPIGRLLLIRSVPKEELASAIAWMSMPVLIGPVLAPLIGGWLVTYASWQWIFLVKLPFGIAGLIAGWLLLPQDLRQPERRFDWLGFLLCAFVIAAAQLALEQVVHPFMPLWLTAVSVCLLPAAVLAYWWHARRSDKPALDFSLMRLRLFRAGMLAGGLSRIGMNAFPFLLQLQLQIGFQWSAARAGTIVFAIAAGALVLKPVMRRVLAWLGFRRTLFFNALICAGFTAALGLVGPQVSPWLLLVLVLCYGVSRSLQFNTVNTMLFSDVPKEKQSASTALGGVGQQLSMALGVSIAAALVAQLAPDSAAPDASTFGNAILVAAAITAVSGFLFLSLKPSDGAAASGHRPKPI
jgi:EmrB/QacA subfamily drug resistance transporter